LDLPSKKEVKIFLNSLDNSSIQSKASTCSKPVKSSIGYATATGISFGKAAIIFLSLAPKGMEDVPEAIRKEMEIHAKSIGFIDLIVVDSHNGHGDVPSEEECRQLSEAGYSVLGKLKNEKQYELSVGYAHTTLGDEETLGDDIGPAGIGILSLEIDGSRYALVVADSNNMILGLREKFIEDLKSSQFELLEFCTSDTHSMAAKIMNSKGYFNLGEDTQPEHLIKTVRSLVNQTVESSEPAHVNLSLSKANVKIMGEDLLAKIDYTINACVDRAKKGGFILGILAIGLFLIATT
jgi:putative membrane protein